MKRKQKSTVGFIIKRYGLLFLFLVVLSKCGYELIHANDYYYAMKNKPKRSINAVVINEVSYFGISPISQDHAYKYSLFICAQQKYFN